MAFTIVFEAVAFETLTLDFDGNRFAEEQFFLVPAVPAFAFRATGLSHLKALAIVLLTASLCAGALAHSWSLGVSAGGSGTV